MLTEVVMTPDVKTRPSPGQWTYEDYLQLPDDGNRYEIIEGVLYVTSAPTYDHQFVVSEILFQLKLCVREQDLGVVLTAPFEVHLSESSRPVQPDVLFIKRDRQPEPGAKFFAGPPDLVVEVISPSSVRTDQVIKFRAYEKAGVPEYWLINPKTRSLKVFTLSEQEYTLLGQFTDDEPIESAVLPQLNIKTSSLFQPAR